MTSQNFVGFSNNILQMERLTLLEITFSLSTDFHQFHSTVVRRFAVCACRLTFWSCYNDKKHYPIHIHLFYVVFMVPFTQYIRPRTLGFSHFVMLCSVHFDAITLQICTVSFREQ